jgi:hypothetical protein
VEEHVSKPQGGSGMKHSSILAARSVLAFVCLVVMPFWNQDLALAKDREMVRYPSPFQNDLEQLNKEYDRKNANPWKGYYLDGYKFVEQELPSVRRGLSKLPVVILAHLFTSETKSITGFKYRNRRDTKLFGGSKVFADLSYLPLHVRQSIVGALAACGAFPKVLMAERYLMKGSGSSVFHLRGNIGPISYKKISFSFTKSNMIIEDLKVELDLSLQDSQGKALWSRTLDFSFPGKYENKDITLSAHTENMRFQFTRELFEYFKVVLSKNLDSVIGDMVAALKNLSGDGNLSAQEVRFEDVDPVPLTILASIKLPKKLEGKAGTLKVGKSEKKLVLDCGIDGQQFYRDLPAISTEIEKLTEGIEKDKGYRFEGKTTFLVYPGTHLVTVVPRIYSGRLYGMGASSDFSIDEWQVLSSFGKIEVDVKPSTPLTIEAIPVYKKKKNIKDGLETLELFQVVE